MRARQGLRSAYLRRAPQTVATVATVLGLLTVVDALFAGDRHHARDIPRVLPVPASATATAVTFVAGLLLLRVAAGLRKRKRLAWRVSTAAASAMSIAPLFRAERRILEGVISLVLLALLVAARSRFVANCDPHSRWFAVRVVLQFTGAAFALGIAMTYLSAPTIGQPSIASRLREVAYAMVGADGPVQFRSERFSDVMHGTLLAITLVTVTAFVLLILRSSEPVARLTEEDEQQLRVLLAKQGERDSLGYFALRDDKSVVWSPTGKSAISYRVVLGVALASGDPIGDPEAWPGSIAAFRELVDSYGWTPAVIGCSELGATVFKREYGLNALALGDEAIVDSGSFCLEGRSMRGVRQAHNGADRAGYTLQIRRAHEIVPEELAELRAAAERWRGNGTERGFSMALSRLGSRADPQCVIVTANLGGELHGLLHFVPWGQDGLSLDLMRRDREADNGLNEFMLAGLFAGCRSLGVRQVSLNFAVFREALERGGRIGAGPVLRAWRGVLMFLSRWWQIESLYRFNVKFRGEWEPRFLSYPAARDLPRIAVAALEAEAFLVRPHRLMRLLGRGGAASSRIPDRYAVPRTPVGDVA
ncbi:MAG TPA: phosphatidylglycerol lysyltransferase domain-containing protein [Jatrophihabitans sp.]